MESKLEKKVYDFIDGDEKYHIEVNIREDKSYKLIIHVYDGKTGELITFHQTKWLILNTDKLDSTATGIVLTPEKQRNMVKIFYDLCVRNKIHRSEMIDAPLFARYHGDIYYEREDQDDMNIEFSDTSEVWLSCDNNMEITIIMLDASYKFYNLEELYELDPFPGDDQFGYIIENGDEECYSDEVSVSIYKWVYENVKQFHTNVFGKEIDNILRILPKELIGLILNYLV